jgi:hypothetical protein
MHNLAEGCFAMFVLAAIWSYLFSWVFFGKVTEKSIVIALATPLVLFYFVMIIWDIIIKWKRKRGIPTPDEDRLEELLDINKEKKS